MAQRHISLSTFQFFKFYLFAMLFSLLFCARRLDFQRYPRQNVSYLSGRS
jgi:hypothetical protein